jgi:hypothetical protein
MAGTTSVWAGKTLDFITGRAVAYTAPRNTYLALASGNPDDDDWTMATLPEITTPGYARQQVVWTAPTGAPMTTQNTALLFYGPFTADMLDSANYAALVTAQTGTTGEVIYVWPIDSPLLAVTNESLQIAAGALTLNA